MNGVRLRNRDDTLEFKLVLKGYCGIVLKLKFKGFLICKINH
jgi:hypothetical protein